MTNRYLVGSYEITCDIVEFDDKAFVSLTSLVRIPRPLMPNVAGSECYAIVQMCVCVNGLNGAYNY